MAQIWAGLECQWLREILIKFKYNINIFIKIFVDNKDIINLV